MAGEVERLTAKVHQNPLDTTGGFVFKRNSYTYSFPEKGKHSYKLAVANGDVDWKEIDQDSKAYRTLESVAPQAIKAKLERPSLLEQIMQKFTPKKEFGGHMNYSIYLENGGILEQAPKELVDLVMKAMSGDVESGKSLSTLIQQNPEAEGIVQQIAEALTSNNSPTTMKCGGRVQKAEGGDKVNLPSIKTRKLEGKELSFVESTSAGRTKIDEYKDKEGNKYRYAEFTDPKGNVHKEYIFNGKKHKSEELHEEDMKKFTKSTKKAERGLKIGGPKCSCAIKKVGGRLIEVDSCTGLPVYRTGAAIKKFQVPAETLQYTSNTDAAAGKIVDAVTANKKSPLLGNVYVGYNSNTISTNPNHSYMGEKGNFGNLGDYQYYIDRDGRNTLYALGKDGKYYRGTKGFWANGTTLGMGGDNFNKWEELSGDQITDEIRGYFKPQTAVADGGNGRVSTDAASVQGKPQRNIYGQVLQPDGKTYAGVTYGQRNAAAAGMLGANGQGMTVDERKAWMQGAGKEYLAQLNGGKGIGFDIDKYSGTAAENRALFNAYKGFGAWQSAQPQEQPTVYSNKQLLDMSDDQATAAKLSDADIARRTRLNQYQAGRNAALTFNGVKYDTEGDYNQAVRDYNMNLSKDYLADQMAAKQAFDTRRALATRAGTRGITARRQAAFDNLVKQQNGTLNIEDLTMRDIRDMRRQDRRDRKVGYGGMTKEDFYSSYNSIPAPTLAKGYSGAAALTEEELNRSYYKQGGQLNYANYLN